MPNVILPNFSLVIDFYVKEIKTGLQRSDSRVFKKKKKVSGAHSRVATLIQPSFQKKKISLSSLYPFPAFLLRVSPETALLHPEGRCTGCTLFFQPPLFFFFFFFSVFVSFNEDKQINKQITRIFDSG